MNGLFNRYHLDESIYIFRDIRSIFSFLFHFSMRIMSENRIAPDGTTHFAASHLGLFCLPTCMSHKKDARLKLVKDLIFILTTIFKIIYMQSFDSKDKHIHCVLFAFVLITYFKTCIENVLTLMEVS